MSGVKAIFKGPAGALAVCNKRSQSDSFRPGPSGAYNIGRRGPCHGRAVEEKTIETGPKSLESIIKVKGQGIGDFCDRARMYG